MLSVITIDDVQHANEHMKRCCKEISFVKLLETFSDPFDALQILKSGKVDLLFLDFHMGGISAPEFMKYVPTAVQVIIVSSEMKSLIDSYQIRIISVINKPYNCQGLIKVCQFVKDTLNK